MSEKEILDKNHKIVLRKAKPKRFYYSGSEIAELLQKTNILPIPPRSEKTTQL